MLDQVVATAGGRIRKSIRETAIHLADASRMVNLSCGGAPSPWG